MYVRSFFGSAFSFSLSLNWLLRFSPAVFVSGGVAVFGTFSICPVLVLPFFAGPD